MAVLSGSDAVFYELEVALGRRRRGDAGTGRYVERQQQPAENAELASTCHSNQPQVSSPQPCRPMHASDAADFSGLVRSKLEALVTPSTEPLGYQLTSTQLPPPGADLELQSAAAEVDTLLLVGHSGSGLACIVQPTLELCC